MWERYKWLACVRAHAGFDITRVGGAPKACVAPSMLELLVLLPLAAAGEALPTRGGSGIPSSPTTCQHTDGSSAPCGPGNDLCHYPGYGTNAPQFHVRDFSCGMNDPAAVVYDPVHAVYHDHWEDHVAAPGGQYTRGHAVSRDMIHWAHMPVSLWNDRPYDSWAIFTGSATVVDGNVVQIYPGLCHGKPADGCPGQTNLAIAVPQDPTDPLQTNWTKDGKVGTLTGYVNPIANDTGRDPSTAWRTPSGEWRITSYGSQIFGSMDFKTWYHIGHQQGFPMGECPSFFPLPKSTPGAGSAAANDNQTVPTHVVKSSHGDSRVPCMIAVNVCQDKP
eukprot:COSAG02_NODE_9793_length_2109_cov_1.419900_1_plen_333_part_00